MFQTLGCGFALALASVLCSKDFWFSVREAGTTADRCNEVLRTFNVFYNANTAKLFHLPRRPRDSSVGTPGTRVRTINTPLRTQVVEERVP